MRMCLTFASWSVEKLPAPRKNSREIPDVNFVPTLYRHCCNRNQISDLSVIMMLCVLFLVSHIALTTGLNNGECSYSVKAGSRFRNMKALQMSTEEEFERPKVQIKRIVESLSSGEKKGSEVEMELKAVETEKKLLILSTGVAGSLIGLISGGIIDGTLANGNAAWAGPVGYAVLGAAAYYGVTQEKKPEVSELLISFLGKPTLKSVKSALVSIQLAIAEAKASAIKKVEDTVEDIVRVPVSIRNTIVDAKDDAVTKVKAFPAEIQNAAKKSYEDAKQSAIQKVDDKVAEVSFFRICCRRGNYS